MKISKPVTWALYGIFVFLLFEFALFCSGRFLLLQRRTRAPDALTIVCVGDSHTFGVGTSASYSYPQQLAALLHANNKTQKISVVNLGIPGAGTKRQIQELCSYFEHNNAYIVILLTGRNNESESSQWGKTSLWDKIIFRLGELKVVKFLRVIAVRFSETNRERYSDPAHSHTDYMNFYLAQARKLCLDKGSQLVLLSYYNSSDRVIKDFAGKYHVPYFEFSDDFDALFNKGGGRAYISPDMSHLNHKGYKFFAERLYERLFLQQAALGIKIYPLSLTSGENDFYRNDRETELMIQAQKERLAQTWGSEQYPFELVHLGHIYMEAGNREAARECYLKAVRAFDYGDNNTIVAPIINWYSECGRKQEAIRMCEEILLHNPENNIARFYRDQISFEVRDR